MIGKFLDPKNDLAFKKIFGTERNKDILIHFLNDVIMVDNKKPIVSIDYLPPVQDSATRVQKTSIVDVLCEDSNGSRYIVEMQVANTRGFEKRAQFYAARAYSSQATVGSEYADLKEVIFLAIADYVMFPNKENYKSSHMLLDQKTHENDLRDFSFTFIELPKFNKSIEKLLSWEDKWCYFFRYANQMSQIDLDKLAERGSVFQKAYSELERFNWSATELHGYEQIEKERKDYEATLGRKFDEGSIEGSRKEREKAEQEKAELRVELMEKARQEKTELLEKARKEQAELMEKAKKEQAELMKQAEKEKAEAIKNIVRALQQRSDMSATAIAVITQLPLEKVEALLRYSDSEV